jgi:hypothetical protein
VLRNIGKGTRLRILGSQHECNNQTVKTKSFGEDEHKNHANKNGRLLSIGSNTSVANDSDAHACGKTGKTTDKATSKMGECGEERKFRLGSIVGDSNRWIHFAIDDNGDDETVNTDNTYNKNEP